MINAQKILDTTLVDIPYIGKNGGAHILNWSFDDDKKNIYIYAYSHIDGSQIVTNVKEINKAKEKHDEKSFFGKLLTSGGGDNRYENTVIPIIYEKSISTSDFSSFKSKKLLFHKVDDVPYGKEVYFKKGSGIVDVSLPFKTGQKIKYHYKSLNVPFRYAPQYNKDILKLKYIELKGEGMLGLKNIKPILISKRGFFTYDKNKGYISKTESKNIVILSNDDRLKGYNFIQNSDQSFGGNYLAWFVKEKDFSKYRLVVADEKGNIDIKPYDFEAPRKLKVLNKGVYDKDLNLKGVLNVFAYHRKGKKNKEIYPVNKFDIIYTNFKGDLIFNTQINYGTERKYKNVISPILVFENDKHQLELVNNHIVSLFKSTYEKFTIDKDGVIALDFTKKYFEVKNDSRINYYHYLSGFDKVDKFGDFYVIRKIITDAVDVPVKNSNGTLSSQKKDSDVSVNITILDKDLKPLDFKSFAVAAGVLGKLHFQTIENNEDEIIFLARKERKYYMFKIKQSDSKPIIEFFPLNLEYSKVSTPKLYFGSFNQNFALVDKEERCFYLMNQFYDFKSYKSKVIDKVGITKIKY